MNNAQQMLLMLDQLRETGEGSQVLNLEDKELRDRIIRKYGTGPSPDGHGSPQRSMLTNVN